MIARHGGDRETKKGAISKTGHNQKDPIHGSRGFEGRGTIETKNQKKTQKYKFARKTLETQHQKITRKKNFDNGCQVRKCNQKKKGKTQVSPLRLGRVSVRERRDGWVGGGVKISPWWGLKNVGGFRGKRRGE